MNFDWGLIRYSVGISSAERKNLVERSQLITGHWYVINIVQDHVMTYANLS